MTDDLATEEHRKSEAPKDADVVEAALQPAGGPAEAGSLAPGETGSLAPADVDTDEVLLPDPFAEGSRKWLRYGALVLALGTLAGTLTVSGIWEPPELRVADLSRRIAVNLLGASGLTVAGGVNTVPTAGELGKGELPFTSIALAFKLFGLSEWAGRLPMALYGLLAVAALYAMLSRLVDKAAAAFATIVLVTSPLFFLQARTMLGDAATMAGLTLAVAGLSVAAFDTRLGAGRRAAWALAGALGMGIGFGSRGMLIGVAVPACAVGLAQVLRRSATPGDRLGAVFGVTFLAVGLAALALVVRAFAVTPEGDFSRLLGGTLAVRKNQVTFDAVILQIGHGMLPWSALLPFAFGRLLIVPPGVSGTDLERETSARLVVSLFGILAFGAYALVGPTLGVWPFGAVAVFAAAVAITFRDFERGVPCSRLILLGVLALAVLFATDFKNFPEKGLSAFSADDAKFPDSFKDLGTTLVRIGALGAAALFALFLFERGQTAPAFERGEHKTVAKFLRRGYDGNVAFGLVALEVSLVAFAAVTQISDRSTHWKGIETMTVPLRALARYGFAAVPLLVAAPFAALFLRDVVRAGLRWIAVSRASAALVGVALGGACLSFVYYPLLCKQISPKEVFESFRRWSRPGDELGMIGAGSGTARYYAQRDVHAFGSPTEAFGWLSEQSAQRRWLVLRAADLGQLNSQYRSKKQPARNLPILDARSSEILLASNQLLSGEANQNPLAGRVLDARPAPMHPLDIDFNGQLRGIGWDIATPSGERVEWIRAGKPYVFRLYYEVTRSISGDWQTFIHIDGYQRRYNGDHDTLDGKYPFHLWRVGDFVVDEHRFELEPNFTAGTYTAFFGLFRGDQRLAVKSGPAQENRVTAGPVEVR